MSGMADLKRHKWLEVDFELDTILEFEVRMNTQPGFDLRRNTLREVEWKT